MEHRWVGLGIADFTDAQARTWAAIEGLEARDEDFTLFVRNVVCLVCDSPFPASSSECVVPEDLPGHRWVAHAEVQMAEAEAQDWAGAGEAATLTSLPKAANVVCGLCGSPVEQAEDWCAERGVWRWEGSMDL